MRLDVRAGWLLVPLLVGTACVQDFSAFRFEQKREPEKPAARPIDSGTPEPDATEGSGGSSGMAAADSGAIMSMNDATPPEPPPEDAGPRDAGPKPQPDAQTPRPDAAPEPPRAEAGAPDAASELDGGLPPEDAGDDAGAGILLQMCTDALDDLATGATTCRECACDWCASQVVDCLVRGSESERQLCREVLRCSLQNRCQDYTCYCSTPGCDMPEPVGNGPCAEVVNAAAGGTRNRVNALRNASPLDPNEPLIRAGQAIACIYGIHSSSPGPAVTGMCNPACE